VLLRYIRVVQFKAGNLAPDAGAIALVEIEQLFNICIAAVFYIALNEAARQVRPAVVVQIHRQERHFGGDIGVPEAVVELDAVINNQPVFEADMGGMQVSVASLILLSAILFSSRAGSLGVNCAQSRRLFLCSRPDNVLSM
jgi:hypothetical protein